jgi:negative regulator of sigma E activity
MEKQFDFNEVGKRMPYYDMPDGFFDRLQDNVMHEIHDTQTVQPAAVKAKSKTRKAWVLRLVPLTSVAAAALVAWLLIPHNTQKQTAPQDGSYAQVEQAFNNLSDADRNYLVSTYQDDLFLNQ